jgi:hypothetical protein
MDSEQNDEWSLSEKAEFKRSRKKHLYELRKFQEHNYHEASNII